MCPNEHKFCKSACAWPVNCWIFMRLLLIFLLLSGMANSFPGEVTVVHREESPTEAFFRGIREQALLEAVREKSELAIKMGRLGEWQRRRWLPYLSREDWDSVRPLAVYTPSEYSLNSATISSLPVTYSVNNESFTSTITKDNGCLRFDVLATRWKTFWNVTLTQRVGNGSQGDFFYQDSFQTGHLAWDDIPEPIQVAMGHISKNSKKKTVTEGKINH